jgi:hypothetical protein
MPRREPNTFGADFSWSYGTVTALTAATGSASNTINDVTASFSQTILNNNFKSLASKVNELIVILQNNGTIS